MIQLSTHFTLEELTYSDTAKEEGILNKPNDKEAENLKLLCQHLLEPIRTILDVPIRISSGFRCQELNRLIGGVSTSQHTKGQAADIQPIGISVEEAFNTILNSNLIFDQAIIEVSGNKKWIHVSYKKSGNRCESLRANRVNGKMVYERV